jgi:hypothetical protein
MSTNFSIQLKINRTNAPIGGSNNGGAGGSSSPVPHIIWGAVY